VEEGQWWGKIYPENFVTQLKLVKYDSSASMLLGLGQNTREVSRNAFFVQRGVHSCIRTPGNKDFFLYFHD